jgi:putative transposase
MAQENRLWGAERIRGELLKLGIRVCKRTIQKYLRRFRKPSKSSQTWASFLRNQAKQIWACDFTVVYDLLFRPLHVFVMVELATRRVVHAVVTRSPTDPWTAKQLREDTPWGQSPKFLIHDRDSKYGHFFSRLTASSRIHELITPYRAPRANAVCERFIGSLKRECLDQTLILGEHPLNRVVQEYVTYYNQERPHQGIRQKIPSRADQPFLLASGKIVTHSILDGLHHSYARIDQPV